jgi:XRE family transcriptional regulator, regulator of sulfur utilization
MRDRAEAALGRIAIERISILHALDASSDLTMRVAREVRAQREARGLSLSAAAARAGVSRTILAKIEAGAGNPSLETLSRIAESLDVTVGALLAEDERLQVNLLARDAAEWLSFPSGIRGRLIHVDGRDRRLELIEIRLDPGVRYASAAHAPGTEELVICLNGKLAAGPEGHELSLGRGDAAHFAADVPHVYRSDAGASALCCFTYSAVRAR